MKKGLKISIIVITCVLVIGSVSFVGYSFYMNKTYISKDKVKEIILKDTNLDEKDVVFKQIDLETDDGLKIYEVEFYYNRVEYNYEVEAKTGKIIYSDFTNNNSQINNNDESSNIESNNNTEYITSDEAKERALKDANLSIDNVKFIKAELDYDKGKRIYEIDFIYNGLEYEYEIDATQGDVISKKQERMD